LRNFIRKNFKKKKILLQQCAHRVAVIKIDLQHFGTRTLIQCTILRQNFSQQRFPLRGKRLLRQVLSQYPDNTATKFQNISNFVQIWLQYWKILQQNVAKNLTFGFNIENTATEGCNRRSRTFK